MSRILLSIPHMGGNEQRYVQEAFDSNWVSTVGPNLGAFEEAFRQLIGHPCVALASGTAAIHLGLRLLGVGPGDEVVCPTLTFVATVNPVVYLGARPIFVDSDRLSWNLDPLALAELLELRARAGIRPKCVIAVDLFGQSADIDAIQEICAHYDIPVLEDAAEALGATYKGVPAGSKAPISVYSFNGNKIITTSGGGMLVAHDQKLIDRARHWSTQAREPGLAYHHLEMGYNYRLSNVLAGIGRGQLEVLDERVRQRRAVAARYRAAFAGVPGLEAMPDAPFGVPTNWLSVFLVDPAAFGATRDELIAALDRAAIESRPVWKPMHLQPIYESALRHRGAIAEDLFARGICLPSSSSLSTTDQDRVIEVVQATARR